MYDTSNHETDTAMHQLILLVSDPDTRELFQQWLEEHPIINPNAGQPGGDGNDANEEVEVHIVDALVPTDPDNIDLSGRSVMPILFPLPHTPGASQVPEAAVQEAAQQRINELTAILQTQQEQLLRIQKAVENTSEAISIADVNGTALYHNRAFVDLYGYTINELNASGVPETLFVNPAIARDLFVTTRRGDAWRGDVLLRTKENRIVPTDIRADSIEDDQGQQIGLVMVYTDITERKRVDRLYREQQIMAEALRDTAAAITSTLNLDEVLDRVLVNMQRVVPHDVAYLLLFDEGQLIVARKRETRGQRSSQPEEATTCPVCLPGELAEMAQSGTPIVVNDYQAHAAAHDSIADPAIGAYIGVPIKLKKAAIGFMYLISEEPGFFSSSHERYLQLFAEQAAIALHNARAHEKSKQLASLQERQRLARDLHDAVSQTLFSASVISEALPLLWKRKPELVEPQLQQLHRLTRGALAEMRSLLLELRPAALMEAQLGQLLKQLTDALQGRATIDTTLKVEGERELPENVQKTLYYIAQEALNNVVQHASASQVYVRLRNLPNRVELAIHDDGVGFDLNERSATSMGVDIMRERAHSINAEFAIHSQPEKGTLILVTWWNKGD